MFYKIVSVLAKIIGKINWGGNRYKMSSAELELIRNMLKDNYYIILTRHKGHMSTYAISLAHKYLTGNWGHYAHALMNLEGDDVTQDTDYRFIEATGKGVHYSYFMDVFSCDSVALLKPKTMSIERWSLVLEKLKANLGKPYDTMFNLADDSSMSCVELIRSALMNEPNYLVDYANFEAMIQSSSNLDPNMFYECPDFTIVWESRH